MILQNSRRNVKSEKDGIWTHDPPWSSQMLYHWATGEQRSNCEYWFQPHRAATQPPAGSYELTNSIALSHMKSQTALRGHIKAYRDGFNQLPEWVYYREITTTWYNINSRRNVDSEKNPSPSWDLNPRPSVTLAYHRVSRSSVVEHPTRSWRVVGSNPI